MAIQNGHSKKYDLTSVNFFEFCRIREFGEGRYIEKSFYRGLTVQPTLYFKTFPHSFTLDDDISIKKHMVLKYFRSEIDQLPSSGQEKPHGSLDSLLKESNAEKELEIVREAFRKQAALLKEKYRNLQDSKTKLEQKLELQSEALAQVREKNKSLEIELNQRDDKIKSFDESLKNTSTKSIKVS